ncbi:MAG: S-layer protein, partial [Candidatus Nanohaloarchaea archaeon]
VDDSSEPSSPSAGSYQDGDDILSVTKTTSGGVSLGGTTLNNFASTTTHTGSSGYVDGNAIVDESGGSVSNEYDSGDSVLTGSIGSGGSVQYWSTDSEETNAVSGLRSKLPDNNPAVVFIEDKSNSDTQYSYVVEPEWNSGDSETQIKQPVFTDSSKRKTDSLDSNSDVTAGYDVYGTYSEYDSDGQHSVSLMYPNGQSTVGAAFTSSGGTLSKSGSSGSIETKTPTGFPDSAKLDSEVSPEGKNLILVGGPSVNTLVKTLAENGDTWKASDYSQNKALLDYVSEAFNSAGDALVVAGYSGKDTRAAANYIADYAQHKEELAGKSQKVLNTQ